MDDADRCRVDRQVQRVRPATNEPNLGESIIQALETFTRSGIGSVADDNGSAARSRDRLIGQFGPNHAIGG